MLGFSFFVSDLASCFLFAFIFHFFLCRYGNRGIPNTTRIRHNSTHSSPIYSRAETSKILTIESDIHSRAGRRAAAHPNRKRHSRTTRTTHCKYNNCIQALVLFQRDNQKARKESSEYSNETAIACGVA